MKITKMYTLLICLLMLTAQAHSSTVTVLHEDFSGTALDPDWAIAYVGNIKSPYWSYSVSGGYLTVTDLHEAYSSSSSTLEHTAVRLTQTFDAVTDFVFSARFIWNQNSSLNATDMFMFSLGNIVRFGYRDVWQADKGQFEIYPTGSTSYTGDRTFPFSGDVNVMMTREDGVVKVYWDNTLRKTFTNTNPLTELYMLFDFKALSGNSLPSGFFGTQRIDYVNIDGTLLNPPDPDDPPGPLPVVIPEPSTIMLLIACLAFKCTMKHR